MQQQRSTAANKVELQVMQQRTSTEPSDQQRGSGQPSVLGMGPNPEPTALFSGGLPGFASNEPTVSAMPDGTGWYQQEVFYATDRDFDPNNKKYGTKQHIPLRYGVVPVRIPKVCCMSFVNVTSHATGHMAIAALSCMV